MPRYNHWINELPEFNLNSRMSSLLNEREQNEAEITRLFARSEQIEVDIQTLISSLWDKKEIADAKESFHDKNEGVQPNA
jgi:hypothetical protein